MRHQQPYASITPDSGALVYRSSYDAGLVTALKAAIPASARCWDRDAKAWRIDAAYGSQLVAITMRHLGIVLKPPAPAQGAPERTRTLDVRYIGATKDRGDGTRSAFGWADGGWSVVFPETVLREWFGAEATPGEATTLYGVLGLRQNAAGHDIKTAYRRMALQWHPDRCKEPDAAEVFIRIQRAYEVLSNPLLRARYDAGLELEKLAGRDDQVPAIQGYRSPLRCGLILAKGHDNVRGFLVTSILHWVDITNARGETLVVSWPRGADRFQEEWV